MEIVVSVATKIGEYLVEPVGRQFGYLIYYNSNIESFKSEVEKLREKKDGVKLSVDAAIRNGEVIAPAVENWLRRVDRFQEELGTFFEDVEAKRAQVEGWCPDLKSRYSLSRKAKKKTQFVVELQGDISGKFDQIGYVPAPPDIASTSSGSVKGFETRKLKMELVMESLKDEKIKMIGICGMGGVGKTTMVKEVAKRAEKDDFFENVVMAVVSQNPNLKNIQGEMADKLGLKFQEESLSGRAGRLCARLRLCKRVLVILDDLWEKLDLEAVGLPLENHDGGCKIVLTSRKEEVCGFMGSQKNFEVEVLPEQEAWDLFRKMAGDVVDSRDLNPIAKEVANKCGGLPIALVTVGRALENRSKPIWNDALQQLKKSAPKNISGMHKDVYSRIELSYDFLESKEEKSCFLLCCLFPDDFDIDIDYLVWYGMGLGSFENIDNLIEARNRVVALVDKLKRSFLLLDSEEEGCVKMHDVVRDVAISIASKVEHGFMVKCDNDMKEWPNKDSCQQHTAISLLSEEMGEHPDGMECPKLKLLQLMFDECAQELPGNFFVGMKELKVVALRGTLIPSVLPSSLQFLLNLRTLCLQECDLQDISVIGGLRNLEILSLRGSGIGALPSEIGQLSHLRLLNLTNCRWLNRIPPGVLSKLCRLEELYMRNSFKEWESEEEDGEKTNARLAELKSLSRLIVLEIHIPTVKLLPKDLLFENLKNFKISIGDDRLGDMGGYYPFQNDLRAEVDAMEGVINVLSKKAENVTIKVKHLKNLQCEVDKEGGFAHLKDLSLEHCDELEYLFNLTDWTSHTAFPLPLLESLTIKTCPQMKEIFCGGQLPKVISPMALPQLRRLNLDRLPEFRGFGPKLNFLKQEVSTDNKLMDKMTEADNFKDSTIVSVQNSNILFPSNWIQWSKNLERLDVVGCDLLEVVFDFEGLDVEEGRENIALPRLKTLYIYEMKKLTHIWRIDRRGIQGFQNLTNLYICKCNNLRNLLSPSIAKLLVKLQNLQIDDCSMMEEIVTNEQGRKEATDIIVFPEVIQLELQNLPNLVSFSFGLYTFEWPSLKIFKLAGCPKLNDFGSASPSPRILKKTDVGLDSKLQLEGDFNALITTLKFEKIALISIEELSISNMDCLKEIWYGQLEAGFFNNLRKMEVVNCPNVMNVIPIDLTKRLQKLKRLEVIGCDSLEVLFHLEGVNFERTDAIQAFNCLEELNLYGLPKLMQVWKKSPQRIRGFQNLSRLEVCECKSLRSLFLFSIAKLLVKLEEITISKCEMMEHIIAKDGEEDTTNVIVFPKVKSLKLDNLPNLTSFGAETYTINGQFLEELKVSGCPRLKTLGFIQDIFRGKVASISIKTLYVSDMDGLTEILYGPFEAGSFDNLTDVKVVNCPNVMNVIPFDLIKRLQKLEGLEVNGCDSLEVLFHFEGVNFEETDVVQAFNCLEELELKGLPNLMQVWKNGPQRIRGFQNLWRLEVRECKSLRSLFSSSIAKLLVNLEDIEIAGCEMMEQVIAKDREEETTNIIIFPKVKSLTLQNLPNLTSFCAEFYTINWPFLEELEVSGCPRVKTFVSAIPSTPKLKEVQTESRAYPLMEDLNTTIQHIFRGKEIEVDDENIVEVPIDVIDEEE